MHLITEYAQGYWEWVKDIVAAVKGNRKLIDCITEGKPFDQPVPAWNKIRYVEDNMLDINYT